MYIEGYSKSKEANKYPEKKSKKMKKIPTGGRKIPRAYSRIAVLTPHRVAAVYPPWK